MNHWKQWPMAKRTELKICDLRTIGWDEVSKQFLRYRMRNVDDGESWTVTNWARHGGHRSYLVHSNHGGLYGVFINLKRDFA